MNEKSMRKITRRSLIDMIGGLLAAVWAPKLWARRESGLYERNAAIERPGTEYAAPFPSSVYQALKTRSRFKAFHGGRLAGKTHAFAEELVRRAEARKIDALCVSPATHSPLYAFPTRVIVESKVPSQFWSARWWSPPSDVWKAQSLVLRRSEFGIAVSVPCATGSRVLVEAGTSLTADTA